MISVTTVSKPEIQFHYDLSTLFYRLLWGQHIHHGLWENDEAPEVAQLNLTDTLAALAEVRVGDHVVDVGCGMGGSSIRLASRYGAQVTGITLSPVQRLWAMAAARMEGVHRSTEFRRVDAEKAEFERESFDVVWSIECTEHLFDKAAFFRRAATWLKPGGRMTICAWLAGPRAVEPDGAEQVRRVCEGFLCPSLGAADDYVGWMRDAGLVVEPVLDWTDRVTETWEICRRRVQQTRVRWLAKVIDRQTTQFLDDFTTILEAYRSGAMSYGCFVARRPEAQA
jgi:tocopherol O-methyltransferase